MKKTNLFIIPAVAIALFITSGCSTDKAYIKKMVAAEVKSEMKGINDFLNVAYAYDNPGALEDIEHMNDGIKGVKWEITKMKKEMAHTGAEGSPAVVRQRPIDIESINKQIEQKLAEMDEALEIKLVKVNNEIEIKLSKIDQTIDSKIDGKLEEIEEGIQTNRMNIKEYKLDMKSNKIDITSNKLDIRANRADTRKNTADLRVNKQEILTAKLDLEKNIKGNHKNIGVNRHDIDDLKRSSAKLLLTINNTK